MGIIKKAKNIFIALRRILLPGKKKDIQIYLICLAAAFGLWLFQALSKPKVVTLSYPVLFEYDQEKYSAFNTAPKNIYFELNISGWAVIYHALQFWPTPIKYRIELDKTGGKEYDTHLYLLSQDLATGQLKAEILSNSLSEQISLHYKGLHPISINPVVLTFGRKAEKELSIQINNSKLISALAKGVEIEGKININPKKIKVSGPEYLIKKMPENLVVNITESRIKSDYVKVFKVKVPGEETGLISKSHQKIKIDFKVSEYVSMQQTLPILFVNFPENFPLKPSQNELQVLFSYRKKASQGVVGLTRELSLSADFASYNAQDSTVSVVLKSTNDIKKVNYRKKLKLQPK